MEVTTMEATRTGGAGNGVWTAARLNTVGWGMRLGIPWAVVGSALLINILIYAIVGADGSSDGNTTGALAALYFTAAITYLQTITQTFGFALSLGVTRRNFYLGAGALVVGESLLHAIGMTILLAVERATGGWGFDLQFFGVPFLVQGNPVSQVLVYLGPLLAMSFLAMLVGVVFKRWGQIGVWVTTIGSVLVFGGLAVLATWLMLWPAVGTFFTATPTLLLIGVYPVVVALVAAVGGYLLVRRATP